LPGLFFSQLNVAAVLLDVWKGYAFPTVPLFLGGFAPDWGAAPTISQNQPPRKAEGLPHIERQSRTASRAVASN